MEREACVCDHGYERSDLCAEIIKKNMFEEGRQGPTNSAFVYTVPQNANRNGQFIRRMLQYHSIMRRAYLIKTRGNESSPRLLSTVRAGPSRGGVRPSSTYTTIITYNTNRDAMHPSLGNPSTFCVVDVLG